MKKTSHLKKTNETSKSAEEHYKKIQGDENIYYVSDALSKKQETKIVLEFADISWNVRIKKTKRIVSGFSEELLSKPEKRLRAPNKRNGVITFKTPQEHIETLANCAIQSLSDSNESSNDEDLLKTLEKRLYNYASRKYKNKQINNKLLTLRKNGKIINLRIIYEMTKSLPRAKKIFDGFCMKYGSSCVSYRVENQLVFDYLTSDGDKGESFKSKLEKVGVPKEKHDFFIEKHLNEKGRELKGNGEQSQVEKTNDKKGKPPNPENTKNARNVPNPSFFQPIFVLNAPKITKKVQKCKK